MKALRIKILDQVLNTHRFKIVLLKEILVFDLVYLVDKSQSSLRLELKNGASFLLFLDCHLEEFDKFQLDLEKFRANEDYYFDLSVWRE
jgi:hypothetical protein